MNLTRILAFISLFVLLNIPRGWGQKNDSIPKQFVRQTFQSTRFVNIPTVKSLPKKGFEFNITHRFGKIDYAEPVLPDFFGLDLVSNIRFGFAIPISKRLYIGLGRTKFDKNYDLEINAVLLKQTKDNEQPITISLYHNSSIMSREFPEVGDNMYSPDTTEFKYKAAHRLAYYTQLSVARKFSRVFSAQVSPSLTYRNLSPSTNFKNLIVTIPVCARAKLTVQSSLVIEANPVIINQPADNYFLPLAISYEINTISHAFQIILSNTNRILNQEVLYHSISNPFNEGLFIGFNLQRFFFLKY